MPEAEGVLLTGVYGSGKSGRGPPGSVRQPCRCMWAGTECAALYAALLAPTTVMV
jgi:hypothetical protein